MLNESVLARRHDADIVWYAPARFRRTALLPRLVLVLPLRVLLLLLAAVLVLSPPLSLAALPLRDDASVPPRGVWWPLPWCPWCP